MACRCSCFIILAAYQKVRNNWGIRMPCRTRLCGASFWLGGGEGEVGVLFGNTIGALAYAERSLGESRESRQSRLDDLPARAHAEFRIFDSGRVLPVLPFLSCLGGSSFLALFSCRT
jgi:hypothetical protein